jgi:gag-polypeptide of LTR copia-type
MTDLNTIRVNPFCGKADECPIWNEKLMAKAKRYGLRMFKLESCRFPRLMKSLIKIWIWGRKCQMLLNETKLHAKNSNIKIPLNNVKGCKSKDHSDGNAAIAWDKLKNKYKPMSALSMVKLNKQFREPALKKGEDPEVWITQLEDICVRLKAMGSGISERQFMIHVLNNLTSVYDLQVALLERKIGDVEQALTVSEITPGLS